MADYRLHKYYDLPINSLKVWTDNPRIGTALDEKSAINLLIETVDVRKMTNLAKDILANGLSEIDIPSVVRENNQFLLYDGNRRIACIKLFFKPSLIDDVEVRQQFQNLLKETPKEFLAKFKTIKVFNTTRERALYLMDLAHNGEQEGVGRVNWEAYQRDLALNKRGMPPKYRTAFFVSKILFNTPKRKDFHGGPSYTDLDRIFGAAVIKDIIGITNDYSKLNQNEIEKITQAYCILKEVRVALNIQSYSRFFNILTPDNLNVIKFINYYNTKVNPSPNNQDSEKENDTSSENDTKDTKNQTEDTDDGKKQSGTDDPPKDDGPAGNDSPPKNSTRRTTRNTLITDSNWEIRYSALPDTYAPIRSLILHLKRVQFDDDKIPDNTLILTLMLRALIDQTTRAYREVKGLKTIDNDLEGAICATADYLKTNNIMPKEVRKSIRTNYIPKLQSYIHHYRAKLSRNDLISVFESLQSYLEYCLDEISKECQTPK